jgi:hypothetical protein
VGGGTIRRVTDVHQCPAATRVEGATPGDSGVICDIMRRDSERADRILEGSPVGVRLTIRDDPTTIVNFCLGTGEPLAAPDLILERAYGDGHYTGCPVWLAGQEIDLVERAFAFERPPMPEGLTRDVEILDGEDADRWVAEG